MPVVTVAFEYGIPGHLIAELLARQMKAELFDRSLAMTVAHRMEVPVEWILAAEEHPDNLLQRALLRLADAAAGVPPESAEFTNQVAVPRERILQLTQEVIRQAVVEFRNIVIAGRGAAFVLRDQPDAIHVLLRADDQARRQMLADELAIRAVDAARLLKRGSADQAAFFKWAYGRPLQDPTAYHLVLDIGREGRIAAIEAILAYSRGVRSDPGC